jgi:hypothetical protein
MRFWRGLAITMISALLGVSSAVVLSLELARRSPLASCAGRESVRFPGAIPLERRRPASAPNPGGAPRDWPIPMPSGAQSLEPMRCGIIAVSERRFGVLDIRVQTGAVMRAMDASFDAGDEAVERVVPAWARDMLVPWGWDGPWTLGQQSMRQLQATGWPWPAFASVASPQFIAFSGPAGWRPELGAFVSGSAPAGGGMPRFWPGRLLWVGFVGNASVFSATWLLVLLASRWLGRRWVRFGRARRNACPACGQTFGSARPAACPECGEPVLQPTAG